MTYTKRLFALLFLTACGSQDATGIADDIGIAEGSGTEDDALELGTVEEPLTAQIAASGAATGRLYWGFNCGTGTACDTGTTCAPPNLVCVPNRSVAIQQTYFFCS